MSLPPGYTLPTTKLTVTPAGFPGQVGTDYHFALGTFSSPSLTAPDRIVGFVLAAEEAQAKGWSESTDLNAKKELVQYSSPNITDRDFVAWPRVSQGDFSAGGLQEVGLDLSRYFDADLETKTPGYLTLRSQWLRSTKTVTSTTAVIKAWVGDFWFSFGEANRNVYSINHGTFVASVTAKLLATDGSYLYYSNGTTFIRRTVAGAEVTIGTAIGNALMMWVVDLGTNGKRLIYWSDNGNLYFFDLTIAFPNTSVEMPPSGSGRFFFIDVQAYQNGVAILTTDGNGAGFDVWFHDLVNMTRFLRVNGYVGVGLTVALGNLYVAANASGSTTSPILAQVSSGSFQIVARPGSPFPTAGQTCGDPVAGANHVYWPIFTPSLNGISGAANGYVVVYDVNTGSVAHLPIFGADDFASNPSALNMVDVLGDSVGAVFVSGSQGICQYQTSAFGGTTFMSSGILVGSLLDFGTPGIQKLMRRITMHHSPLRAGESITTSAFIDVDPLQWNMGLAPAASVVHTTIGDSFCQVLFGDNVLGNKGFVTIQLGSGGATAPTVYWYSWEVTTPYTWSWTVNCTHRRALLSQREDEQGMRGIDLFFFLRELWTNPQNTGQILLYHPSGLTINVVIESLQFWARSPIYFAQDIGGPDLEFFCTITLREAAA
jgi:hypothetical protein